METYVPTVRIRAGAKQTGLGLKASVAFLTDARRLTNGGVVRIQL